MGHHQMKKMTREKEEAMKAKDYYYVLEKNPSSSLKLQLLKITIPSSQSHVQQQQPIRQVTEAVDLMNMVLQDPMMIGWSKKAKRGRRSPILSSTFTNQLQKQGNKAGVYEEIRHREEEDQQKKKKKNHKRFAEELVENNRLTPKKQKRIDYETAVANNITGKFPTEELISTMLSLGYTDIQVVDMILASDARRRGKKGVVEGGITGFDSKQKKSGEFKCITCNKSFSTHQGLGGHRSAGPCKIIKDRREISTSGNELAVKKENQCTDLVDNSTPIVGNHVCRICNKSFSTGWALGGHQTVHRPASSVLKAPTTITSTLSQATSDLSHSAGSRKELDFDLNEPPALEEGEAIHDFA